MKIILSEWEKQHIEQRAKEFGISAEGLTKTYIGVMDCNFEQDIYDIANENMEDIKQEYGEYIDKSEQAE